MSSWPLPQDYNEAVQIPAASFADPALKAGEAVVGARGLPLPRSGNFADVYQFRGADGKDWAVKCFTRPVVGLDRRYQAISDAVARASLPFTVGFQFLSEGVRINGQWYPILKMDWVEGFLLNQFVRDNLAKPGVLDAVLKMWVKLCKRLRDAGIAHADLQHGNVLLVPGAKAGSFGLKLIDYDGMYAPALANTPSGESGHAAYQHPARGKTGAYSPDLDRFPHLAIATALRGLIVGGKDLWDRYDTGDNLLFVEEDFQAPAQSKVMRDLWKTGDPALRVLVGNLALACGRPLPQTPWLDQLAPDGAPAWRDPADLKGAAAAIGVAGTGTVTAPPPPPADAELVDVEMVAAEPPAPLPNAFEDVAEAADTRPRAPRAPAAVGGFPLIPVVIAAGVLVIGGLVGVVALTTGGKRNTPIVSSTDPDDDKGNNPPPPGKEPPTDPAGDPTPDDPPDPPAAGVWSHDQVFALPALPAKWAQKWDDHLQARVRFTHDGRWLLVAGTPKPVVAVLNPATGQPEGEFRNHGGRVVAAEPLADGMVASAAVGEPFALVWDPATRAAVGKLSIGAFPEKGGLPFFAASPDRRFTAVGRGMTLRSRGPGQPPDREGGQVAVADGLTGKTILTTEFEGGLVQFTPDGSRLFLAERGRRLRWFDLPGGAMASEPVIPGQGGTPVATSADGRRVLVGGGTVPGSTPPRVGEAVYDGATGEPVTALVSPRPGFFPIPAAVSADGTRAALVHTDPRTKRACVLVADLGTGLPVAKVAAPKTTSVPGTVAWDLEFSPDGSTLVIAWLTGDATAVTIGNDLIAPPARSPSDPDAPKTVSSAAADMRVRWSYPGAANSNGQALFAADGQSVLLASTTTAQAAVPVVDAATGKSTRQVTRAFGQFGIRDLLPMAGGQVAVPGRAPDDPFAVWDLTTGQSVSTLPRPPLGAGPNAPIAAVSPDGRYVVSARRPIARKGPGFNPAPFRLLDTTTRKELLSLDGLTVDARFTADSSRLLVTEVGGKFRWYRLPTAQVEKEFTVTPNNTSPINYFRGMSADGKVIAYAGPVAGVQSGVCLLDGDTGQLVRRFGQPPYERRADMTPDGRRVALLTMAGGPRVEVVDAASGEVLGRAAVGAADERVQPEFSLSPDGSLLVAYHRAKGEWIGFDVPAGGAVAAAPKPVDPPAPTPPKSNLLAVPEGAALDAAEKKVLEVFKEKYARKQPADRKAFSADLIKYAGETANDPAARFVMLRDAAGFAAEGLDPAAALTAVDELARLYRLPDAWGMKADALAKTKDATAVANTLRAVAEQAIAAAEAATDEDAFDAALKLSAVGAAAGRKANLTALAADADARTALTRKMRDAFDPAKEAAGKLKADPADPGANLLLGKYRCFVQGRWADGLKMLAAGSDPGLKAAAEADLAAPPTGVADTKPADAWWGYAEKAPDGPDRRGAQARARYWYHRALPGLHGLEQATAEGRLAFTAGLFEYKPGLVASFSATKQPSILKGKKARVDRQIDFDGGEFSAVGSAVPLTVTWTGVLVPPRPGRYKLVAVTPNKGDNVRVQVEGKAVIDTFPVKADKKDGVVTLSDKPAAVTVVFAGSNTAAHKIKLNWVPPGATAEELIPYDALYHDKKFDPPGK